MNPFDREKHLEDEHADQVEIDRVNVSALDSEDGRKLHAWFHQGDFLGTDHSHPNGEF